MLTELSKITHFAQNLSIFTHFVAPLNGSVLWTYQKEIFDIVKQKK